ncbi:uncharacterized protein isoform X2 [Musca autumnalis]|uniref:uncharacterized protein isoform X2 n=1 Tax=Musca autumnalis TaxID=221902 RepID=UPI003CF8110A
MNDLKLIKTTFQTRKEIVAVQFDGFNDYNLFVNEVKKTYNIPPFTDVEVFNKEFPIKPHVFTALVLQYISSADFMFDIKLVYNDGESYDDFKSQTCSGSSSQQLFVVNTSTPNPQHLPFNTEVYSITEIEGDITKNKCNVYTTPPPPTITPSVKNIRDVPELSPYLKCKSLANRDRIKIAKAIIRNIVGHDLNKRLLKEHFIKLSEDIVDLFPFEIKETYYIPFQEGRLSKGKLYDAYRNYRRQLKSGGLMDTGENSEPENSNDTEMFNVSQEEHYFSNESMADNDSSTLPSVQDMRRISGMKHFLKRQSLENKDRTKIAHAIIAFILNRNPNRRLLKEDFLQLSQSIVEIFPLEIRETYYIPFSKGHLAKGIITRGSNPNNESNCESTEHHSKSPQLSSDLIKSEPCDYLEFEAGISNSLPCIDNAEASNFSQKNYFNFNTTGTLSDLPSAEQIKEIPEIKQFLKHKNLQNNDRVKIAKAIVAYLLKPQPNRRLVKEDFLQLSQFIVEIFPFEIRETYYIPSFKGRLARGKLYDAYHNQKTKLCAAGIITRGSNSNPENNDESLEHHSNSPQQINDLKAEPCDDLEFETCNSNPLPCIDNVEASNYSQNYYFNTTGTLSGVPSAEQMKQIPEIKQFLNYKTLQNNDRVKLAKAIIAYLLKLNPSRRLLKEDFLQLSQSIVEIFPLEIKETYYIPFSKGRLARGKLYDAYRNQKTKLCAAGIITRGSNSNPESNYDSIEYDSNSPQLVNDLKSEPCDDLEFEICSSNSLPCIENTEATNFSQNHSFNFNTTGTLSDVPSAEQIKEIPEIKQFLKYKNLQNNDRVKIAKAIVAYLLKPQPNRRLGREVFLQLSQLIVEIFPFEIRETYYIPSFKGRLARGKLYDAYHNQKTKLSAAGIITRGSNSNPESNCDSIESPHCNSPQLVNELKSEPCDDLEFQTCSSNSLPCIENAEVTNISQNHYFNFNTTCTLSGVPSVEQIKQIPEIKQFLNYKTLQNKDRIKIAKAIVAYLLNPHPNRQLLKEDFVQLSQSIVAIFPLEIKETYYIPYSKGQLAKGKLYDAYNNHKFKLSAAGLLTRRGIKKSNNNEHDESLTRISETISPDELEVLLAMDSDWNTIKDLWRKSYSHRRKELINDKISTQVYLNRYNISKLNESYYDLLQIDFNILYSTTKHISEEWKIYYSKVIARFQQSRDTNVRNILANISKTNDEVCQLALSLMLIPYMLPIQKITKLESQESFICYMNSEKEYDETESPAKRIKTEETQPKIYFVGDDETVISSAYLDLFGNRLKFENPLKAVEACFYCYTTMNIKYPKACFYTWTFLQKIIYEINTPHDVEIPAVNTLIHDLRRGN